RASFRLASKTGAAFTSTFPSARMIVSDRMSSPTDRSDPSRVDQDTSPCRGPAPPRAASASIGLVGDPTPPDIWLPPLTRARSLFITDSGWTALALYLARSIGLGWTAR